MNENNGHQSVNEEEVLLLKNNVAKYQDFPIKGILFYDIFSILSNSNLSKLLYKNSEIAILEYFIKSKKEFNLVIGLESRGFLLGSVLADRLNVGFVPIRKKSKKNTKLPGNILSIDYTTEYSNDSFDLQEISINSNSKVLLIDDLIATGGSLEATEKLINKGGGVISATFCVFEIKGLNGRKKLTDPNSVISLIEI